MSLSWLATIVVGIGLNAAASESSRQVDTLRQFVTDFMVVQFVQLRHDSACLECLLQIKNCRGEWEKVPMTKPH